MVKGGDLRPLVIPDTGEDAGRNPQPKVRVGNVRSGAGTAAISPTVYQNETDRNIEIVFTAAGPMYDYELDGDDINSRIVIGIPPGLAQQRPRTRSLQAPAPKHKQTPRAGTSLLRCHV